MVENQPYDESLDVNETEDVASIYAPSPPQPGEWRRVGGGERSRTGIVMCRDVLSALRPAGPRAARSHRKAIAENSSEDDDEDDGESLKVPGGAAVRYRLRAPVGQGRGGEGLPPPPPGGSSLCSVSSGEKGHAAGTLLPAPLQ